MKEIKPTVGVTLGRAAGGAQGNLFPHLPLLSFSLPRPSFSTSSPPPLHLVAYLSSQGGRRRPLRRRRLARRWQASPARADAARSPEEVDHQLHRAHRRAGEGVGRRCPWRQREVSPAAAAAGAVWRRAAASSSRSVEQLSVGSGQGQREWTARRRRAAGGGSGRLLHLADFPLPFLYQMTERNFVALLFSTKYMVGV